MMRLANGIVLDKDTTFGELKFSALRREVRIQNEDGSVSDEIKERTYDLKSKGQGRMIQVSIPASVPLKEFDYNAQVKKDSRVRGVLQGHKQITPDQTERKNQHLENVSVKPSVQ